MVARLGLDDSVELRGAVSEAEVRDLVGKADVFALTSTGLGEAAPVAVMEAMACGLPVICSIIGGTPDMISSGEDGLLVPPGDVEAIAASLRRLVQEPDLRASMSLAARTKAVSLFDYRRQARKLEDAILGP